VTPRATPATTIGVATRESETRDANTDVWRAHGLHVGADDGTDARIETRASRRTKKRFFCGEKNAIQCHA
jgi:hypothetical protein